MKLLPRELESLLIHQAGCVAQKRLARGLKLNYPESVALISCQILELARDGCSTVSELMGKGQHILGKKQVMEGVADLIQDLQVEATFPDGTKLVSMNYPICREHGDLNLALYGSFLPVPSLESFEADIPNLPEDDQEVSNSPPGCIYPAKDEDIELNKGKEKVAVVVQSLCDRPIQVGSHFNFVEVNKDLVFDRALAYGKRLNIPAGNAIRFEPGITKTVTLVDISGKRVVRGGNNLCDGPVNSDNLAKVMKKVVARGFGNKMQLPVLEPETCFITRYLYSRTYGPTTGDKVRLGDTSLVLEVEKDFTVYGEECKFGGGKVVREGMGQASQISCHAALDVVITSCVIIDAIQRIIKADIGIKDGKIVGIGKAGNDDVMDDVTPGMLIGAGTDIVAGDGYILTAGGIDCHVHFICPQLIKNAITSGITTMVGGGTGPTSGSCASTCTFGIHHMSLKLHEDWGSTPSAIDTALKVAEAYDVQIAIHTDTLNESCSLEDTVKAFNGRTIHAYHVEGSGGGHAPDIISICKEFNVIPSSTNPTRPYTVNTVDEQYDMLMICHHLDKNLKTDVAFAESRIRAETISAEDVLHDIGAISIIASDSQGMGRIGEVITRTWQTADKMKKQHGRLPEDNGDNDNFRILRYISKYTINPAIAHGLSHVVGSIEIGKLADLVLWKPAFFGVKPHMILKSGQVAWAQMGNPNATIPTPQPVVFRKMFGAYGKCTGANSIIFVSKASIELGNVQRYGISKTIVPVFGIRKIGKKDMLYNNLLPKIKVNPETFKVYIKGEMKPAGENERKETGENELKEEGKNELKEAGENELKVAEENELKEAGDNELEEAGDNELKEAGENELKEAGENELKESWKAMKERKEMKEKKEVWREITCSPVSSLPLAQRYFLF